MQYQDPPLVMTGDSIADRDGTRTVAELPGPVPLCRLRLAGASPLMERLWMIALDDIERGIGRPDDVGTAGVDRPAMRELALAGLLGVNRTHPQTVLAQIKNRLEQRPDNDIAWISSAEVVLYGSDNYEWQWFYETASACLPPACEAVDQQPPDALAACFHLRALGSIARAADLLGRFAHLRDWQRRLDECRAKLATALPDCAETDLPGMALAALDGLVTAVEPGRDQTAPVLTLQLAALERVDGKPRTDRNAALLACNVREDGFHASSAGDAPGHDLLAAASFVNVCLRAGLLHALPVHA